MPTYKIITDGYGGYKVLDDSLIIHSRIVCDTNLLNLANILCRKYSTNQQEQSQMMKNLTAEQVNQLKSNYKEAYDLWALCVDFVIQNRLTCPDDVYQRIASNKFAELTENICNITGYYNPPSDY
jgi:hypothetical protein